VFLFFCGGFYLTIYVFRTVFPPQINKRCILRRFCDESDAYLKQKNLQKLFFPAANIDNSLIAAGFLHPRDFA